MKGYKVLASPNQWPPNHFGRPSVHQNVGQCMVRSSNTQNVLPGPQHEMTGSVLSISLNLERSIWSTTTLNALCPKGIWRFILMSRESHCSARSFVSGGLVHLVPMYPYTWGPDKVRPLRPCSSPYQEFEIWVSSLGTLPSPRPEFWKAQAFFKSKAELKIRAGLWKCHPSARTAGSPTSVPTWVIYSSTFSTPDFSVFQAN